MWPFKSRAIERRATGAGFTSDLIAARAQLISGRTGLAELTGTAQACVSLWEGAFTMADVEGTDVLDRAIMALTGRSLALRGESLWLIRDGDLVPVADWAASTRYGQPTAYRLTISEFDGGTQLTALSAEVLHVKTGADTSAPWLGVAPLRRARLTAALLDAVESALSEVFARPIGSRRICRPISPKQWRQRRYRRPGIAFARPMVCCPRSLPATHKGR